MNCYNRYNRYNRYVCVSYLLFCSAQMNNPSTDATIGDKDVQLTVSVLDACTTRILGIDPSLSCGVSIVQLNAAGAVVGIDVGILDVHDKSLSTDGSRCNKLQDLLRSLLAPLPDVAVIESYHVHPFRDLKDGRWKVSQEGISTNYKVRCALEMLLDEYSIPYSYVAPQTWKKDVIGNGDAEKAEVKDSLERLMKMHFHPRLFSHGRYSA